LGQRRIFESILRLNPESLSAIRQAVLVADHQQKERSSNSAKIIPRYWIVVDPFYKVRYRFLQQWEQEPIQHNRRGSALLPE
jgi:hypothetical protein